MNPTADALPVVLTATIVPNAPGAALTDPAVRLAEYLRVLQFCQRFAPVIFLENSGYPLDRHPEFAESPSLRVRRFVRSPAPQRGKGYQEFEMLDAWLNTDRQPPHRWLKISGRYQLPNLAAILDECAREKSCPLLIDQAARSRMARTYLFSVTTAFYREHLGGLYRQCDDQTGDWIERVLFRALMRVPGGQMRCFKTQPRVRAQAGSSGAAFPTGRFQWLVKQCLRRVNRLFDQRHLWYSR